MALGRQYLRIPLVFSALVLLVAMLACAGPEPRGTVDPTLTPTEAATPTEVPPTPTATATIEPSPTTEPTPEPSPTPIASPTPDASPVTDASPTAIATPTEIGGDIMDQLAKLEELPDEGYEVAEEGSRTAQDLANAYADPVAHLQRLEEWGFARHVFRDFNRTASNNDALPYYILSTVNEYGSDEQAAAAMQWLLRSQTSLGATEQEVPQIGDEVIALTVPTAQGTETASIYVRRAQFVYIYFAEGGDPLAAIRQVAERVFSR